MRQTELVVTEVFCHREEAARREQLQKAVDRYLRFRSQRRDGPSGR